MNSRQRLSNLVWPLILIIAGFVLLFSNLGILSSSTWDVLINLWPLFVVALALSMIVGGGSLFFPLILIAFAAGFLLTNFGVVDWNMWSALGKLWPLFLVGIGLDVLVFSRFRQRATRTETINQPLQGASSAEIKLEPGLGRLELGAGATVDALLAGTATVGPDEGIGASFRLAGTEARIKIKQVAPCYFVFTGGWLNNERRWDLSLNPTIPTRLKIDGGLGNHIMDLSTLNLTALKVAGGIGSMTLTLPAQGRVQAKIDGGVGDKTVIIPVGTPARIKIDSGLGSRRVQGDFTRMGDYYTTRTYDPAAPNRLEVDIDHGIGSLTLAEMPSPKALVPTSS